MTRQRGFIWVLPMIPYIVGALVVGVTVWGAWHTANGWCNASCQLATDRFTKSEAKVDNLEAEKAAAIKRATDLALLWSARMDQAAKVADDTRKANDAKFAMLTQRASAIPAGAPVQLSVDAVRLWGDAARGANDTPTPIRDTEGAAPVSVATGPEFVTFDQRDLAHWFIRASAAYADARSLHAACVRAYTALEVSP